MHAHPNPVDATYALMNALRARDEAWVRESLGRGALLDTRDWNGGLADMIEDGDPIFQAARCGRSACLRLVLDAGGQLELPDRHSRMRPLHHACQVGDAASVKLLLEAGAEVDARDVDGATPAMRACAATKPLDCSDPKECLASLAAAGADIRLLDHSGQDVFDHCAVDPAVRQFLHEWRAATEKTQLLAQPTSATASAGPLRA